MMRFPAAVTGIGVISPFGATLEHFWRGLIEAPSIASQRTFNDTWSLEPASCCAGWIDDAIPQSVLGTTSLRSLSRESRFAVAAAVAALREARWQQSEDGDTDLGIIMGTLYSGQQNFSEASGLVRRGELKHLNPARAPEAGYNAPASQISILTRAQGLNLSVAAGLSSSCEAVRLGIDELRAGRCRAILAGGVDALPIELVRARPWQCAPSAGKPFDLCRSGALLSEAAACLVLERPQEAADRGAEIAAFVVSADVRFWPTHGVSMTDHVERFLRDCISSAKLHPAAIQAVFASASGDPQLDLVEANALHRIFDSVTPICGVKGAIGECFGAGGAVLVAAALLAIRNKAVPPTFGFAEQDPHLPHLNISRTTLHRDLEHVLVVSLDSEGFAGCVVLRAGAHPNPNAGVDREQY